MYLENYDFVYHVINDIADDEGCTAHALVRNASLVSLFTGAKEAKFPYFSKGKPVSSWLISNSSNILFYTSNS